MSPFNRHLFILDKHTSHVTLEVVKLAMFSGLDLLTFPSHTSHALQPLDITCFKPFKVAFRTYVTNGLWNMLAKFQQKKDLTA